MKRCSKTKKREERVKKTHRERRERERETMQTPISIAPSPHTCPNMYDMWFHSIHVNDSFCFVPNLTYPRHVGTSHQLSQLSPFFRAFERQSIWTSDSSAPSVNFSLFSPGPQATNTCCLRTTDGALIASRWPI